MTERYQIVSTNANDGLLDSRELAERDFSEIDLLVLYLDGVQFGPYHVICAVGVDERGHKHVLGFREGAAENAEVAKTLLEDLVARGVSPFRKRLFVIAAPLHGIVLTEDLRAVEIENRRAGEKARRKKTRKSAEKPTLRLHCGHLLP